MSSHRKAPLPVSMRRRPYLKGVCRWCDQPVVNANGEPTRATWHPACVLAFKLIHWPAETRRAVLERDHGVCAHCGVDSEQQVRAWRDTQALWQWLARRHFDDLADRLEITIQHRCDCYEMARKDVARQMEQAGMKLNGASAWQHDHIRPLVEANGDLSYWDISNIQTLCSACHVQKGKEDNARRRAVRQAEAREVQIALL